MYLLVSEIFIVFSYPNHSAKHVFSTLIGILKLKIDVCGKGVDHYQNMKIPKFYVLFIDLLFLKR